MRQTARLWTTAIGAAALIALPVIAGAQVYPPSSGQTTSGQASQQSATARNTPQYHLDQAKQVLDSISTTDLTPEASTQISQLKTQFDDLYNNYKGKSGAASPSAMSTAGMATATGNATTSSQVGTSGSTEPQSSAMGGSASADWKETFNKIESQLDALNIPKSPYAPKAGASSGAGVSGTTGTTGVTPGGSSTSAANVNLPSDVRDKLRQFRMHLEQFYSLAQSQQ